MCGGLNCIPFDRKASHTRLLRENIAANAVNDGLLGRIRSKLLGIIFVIHVVAHADEFPTIIAAGEEDDGHTENLRCGNASEVGRISLEDELVCADRNGPNEKRIEFLVIFRAING